MWTYHTTKISTQPWLTQSSKSTLQTLNQTKPPSLLPSTLKQVLETHDPSLLQPSCSLLNHHKQGFLITTRKISYSLIEPQVLAYVTSYRCKFHAHGVHLHPTFIAPSQSEAYLEPSWTSGIELSWNVLRRSLFLQKSSIIDLQHGSRYAITH